MGPPPKTGGATAIKCGDEPKLYQPGAGGGGGSVGRIALRAKAPPAFGRVVISPAAHFTPLP